MENFLKGVGLAVVTFITIGLFAFIGGFFVMLLWNWLMPSLFGLSTIGFWQGWGISVLSGLLFKNSSSSVSSK